MILCDTVYEWCWHLSTTFKHHYKRNNLKWLIQSVENYKVFESFDALVKFIFFDANKLIILLFQVELL